MPTPVPRRRLVAVFTAGLTALTACASDDGTTPAADAANTTNTDTESTTTGDDGAPAATITTEQPPSSDPEFDEVTAIVEEFVAGGGLNGAGLIVVDRDDGVLYHDHFGEFTPDRVSLIASTSKMISAGVLLHLQDDGLIDVDAPISTYVDWGAGHPDITVAQALSNSSGLVGLGPDPFYIPYICQFDPDTDVETCAEQIFTTDADDADVIRPDTSFRYGGAQWQVAGAVAEAVTGQSWAELIEEIYVAPCDVDSLGYISLGSVPSFGGYPSQFRGDGSAFPTDNPSIEGGAHITTGDYGSLLLMHLRDGMCGDTPVLSPESLALAHADRIAIEYDGTANAPGAGYGLGWYVDRDTGRLRDPGLFGAVAWLDLDAGYGVYLVIEGTSGQGSTLARLLEEPIHTIVTGA